MSDFKTWLSGQLAELDMNPTQLASFVPGLNQPTIHRVLNPEKEGGTPNPGIKTVSRIKEAVRLARLASGLLPLADTQTYSHTAQSANLLINPSEHGDWLTVPRVKFKLSAGVSGYAVEAEEGNGKPVFFRKDWFDLNGYRPDKLFAVRVSGSSMEPSLWDDDLVVINTIDVTPKDGEAFAINFEGELVIKRMRRDSGEWWATSDNADQRRFSPKRCTEDVSIIGKVIYKQSERI